MSTFRKHKSSADRSATDRSRHKQKIEKALKEGIRNIVAEESIIGQDGKKKVRRSVLLRGKTFTEARRLLRIRKVKNQGTSLGINQVRSSMM